MTWVEWDAREVELRREACVEWFGEDFEPIVASWDDGVSDEEGDEG